MCLSIGDLNFLFMLELEVLELNEVDFADLKEELVETLAECESVDCDLMDSNKEEDFKIFLSFFSESGLVLARPAESCLDCFFEQDIREEKENREGNIVLELRFKGAVEEERRFFLGGELATSA